MEIGKKLKEARLNRDLTQEVIAEKLNVSRQTISNWENEKSYPDIISVIELSTLYSISLDDLLKGDDAILLVTLGMFLPSKSYYLVMIFCLAIVSSSLLLYQMIKRI